MALKNLEQQSTSSLLYPIRLQRFLGNTRVFNPDLLCHPTVILSSAIKHQVETLNFLLQHSPAFEESDVENGGVGIDKFQQESLKNQPLFKILVSFWHLWKQCDIDKKRYYPVWNISRSYRCELWKVLSILLDKEVYIYSNIYIYKQYGLTEVSGQPAEDPPRSDVLQQ